MVSPMQSKHMESTAAEWLAHRDSGKWSDADQASLNEWLRASTAHRVAYLRLEAAWGEAGRLKALGAGLAADQVPAPGALRKHPFLKGARIEALSLESAPRMSPRRWAYTIAASVLLVAVCAYVSHFFVSHGPSYETIVGGL